MVPDAGYRRVDIYLRRGIIEKGTSQESIPMSGGIPPEQIFRQNANTRRFLRRDFPQDPVQAGLSGSGIILAYNCAKKNFFRARFMGICAKRDANCGFRKIRVQICGKTVPVGVWKRGIRAWIGAGFEVLVYQHFKRKGDSRQGHFRSMVRYA